MPCAVIGDSVGMAAGRIACQQVLPRAVPVSVRRGGTAYVLRQDIAACIVGVGVGLAGAIIILLRRGGDKFLFTLS